MIAVRVQAKWLIREVAGAFAAEAFPAPEGHGRIAGGSHPRKRQSEGSCPGGAVEAACRDLRRPSRAGWVGGGFPSGVVTTRLCSGVPSGQGTGYSPEASGARTD